MLPNRLHCSMEMEMTELDYAYCNRVVRQARLARSLDLGRLLIALFRRLKPARDVHSGARLAH
jgi:hypothetical protein